MNVVCNTVDEFLICLKDEQNLFQNTVRVSITKKQIDEVRDSVIFQASAVVLAELESQYLLEVGCNCGKDYNDATGEMEGTKFAQSLKEKIQKYADRMDLKVLPGIISI